LGAVCPRDGKGTYVPLAIDNVALFAEQGATGWIHIALRPHTVEHQPVADVTVYDQIGSVAAIFHGLRLVAAPITRSFVQELKEANDVARLQLIENLLEKHVSRVLKSNGAIDKGTPLTDLGLDSVMAMEIQSRLERKLSVSLNPTHFQRGATLTTLSRVVSDLFASRHYLAGASTGATAEETSPLVEISAGDADKTPLFFVHPVGGSVFRYYDIAHYLGPQQPFYGLQSPAVAGIDIELNTIEEMAQFYLSAIRQRQPTGPYMLGGWSMGGVIAFEIARQLYEQGEDISLLAIVDAIAPTDKRAGIPVNDHVFVLKLLALDLGIAERNLDIGYLSTLNEDDGLDYVYATAVASEALPASFSYREFKKRTALFRRNYVALNNYIAKPYSGSAHIFKAEVAFSDRRKLSAALDWDEVVAEIAQVKTLPGDHFTLMHRSHVNILATYLRAALKKVMPIAVDATDL
ncbi:MAG TPA: thioesterase domain-containing protein, partial [Pseudomonadales bacterium]|nr:thioesterase domain-containing protein [Pseudomonadales bacterium]